VRRSEDGPDVGVESHAPKANSSHEFLGAFQLAVASEDGIDELAATVLAHGDLFRVAALLLSRLPHVVLANFEKLVEALPEPFARVEEFVDQLAGLGLANARHGVFGSLDLAGELNEQEPEFACDFGHGSCRAEEENSPVVDPLPKGIRIKD